MCKSKNLNVNIVVNLLMVLVYLNTKSRDIVFIIVLGQMIVLAIALDQKIVLPTDH